MTLSGATPALQPMASCAKYEIIGDATGTASGSTLLMLFNIGGDNSTGSVVTSSAVPRIGVVDPVNASAIYHAIESVPGADAIMAPRYTVAQNGIPFIFSARTVTVKGKAVKYSSAECSKN